MKKIIFGPLLLLTLLDHAQSHVAKGEIALQWDLARLANPFNSTIQAGAEFGITDTWSVHMDLGIQSGLYNQTYYNDGILIWHGQMRKYKPRGFFMGLELFFIHAKDYSDSRSFYNKNKKFNADYDSVTLIKNSPGIAFITGKQFLAGNWVFDLYAGTGPRVVNNRLRYKKETIQPSGSLQPHYNWSNDKYSGTFASWHISFGIRIGYLLNKKIR